MAENKDRIVRRIGQESRQRVAELSVEFARTTPENKGEILDEMEFRRELADMCELCLDRPE